MTHEDEPNDDVTIIPADYTLLRKLGTAKLDAVFSPEIIQQAEQAIAGAAGDLYAECVDESGQLQEIVAKLAADLPVWDGLRRDIIARAFGIKAKAGQAGYNLVAALAKSLHLLCEKLEGEQLPSAKVPVIQWHARSIGQLLSMNIKGDGGEAGKAILAEIEKVDR